MPSCPTFSLLFLYSAILLCGAFESSMVGAQDEVLTAQATDVTKDQILAKLTGINTATGLDDSQRASVVESYQQTLAELKTKLSLEARLIKLQQEIAETPRRIAEAQSEIEELSRAGSLLDPAMEAALKQLTNADQNKAAWLEMATQTLETIESRRNEKQVLLEDARKSLATLQGEPKRRADRRAEIPILLQSLQDRIEPLDGEANANPRTDDLPQAVDARKDLILARKANAELEQSAAKKEFELYDIDASLLPVRVDLAQRQAIRLETAVSLLGTHADGLRQQINFMQTQAAASQTAQRPAELINLAQSNVDLMTRRQDVGTSIQEIRQKLAASVKLGCQLREQFDRIQLQIGPTSQVTEAVGHLLRKTRQELPNVRKQRDESVTRKSRLYDIRFSLIDSEQQLWPFLDMDTKVVSELKKLALEVPQDRLQALEPDLHQLLESQKSALEGLKSDLETYYRELANLDLSEEQVIALTENYAAFIDQRVLWIRSVPPVGISDIADTGKSIRWLLDTTSWTTVLRSFWESGIRRFPLVNTVFVIAMLGLAITRRKSERRIGRLGDAAGSRVCCDIRITLRALFQSVLCASLWPLVFGWLAWNFHQVPNGNELVRPLALACGVIAFIVFAFELWRFILRPNGLAQSHFLWPPRRLQVMRNNLRWFVALWLPVIFMFHVFLATENPVYEKSITRLLFVVAAVLLAVFAQRLGSPKSGLLKEYLMFNRGGWVDQLRWIWFSLLVGIPIAFAVLAILGYQYTAAHLLRRFMFSAGLLSFVSIGSSIGLRWIMLRRRAISIAHARERKSDISQADKAQATVSVGGVSLTEGLDLSVVNAQSVRMLRSLGVAASFLGLYLIWASMMPALDRFDEVPLIPTALTGQSIESPATPPFSATTVPALVSTDSPIADYFAVSLGQLIGAIAVIVVTFIAVQNIPGFMEIILLERLPLDASLRFAITTVTRYVLVTIGVVWVLGSLGIGWGKIQWLVAALSVGLGFGLQEIFANFVSGLILLFERPLRAGDIVTVGQTSGTVVRINTRATTIRDWDRKELIVPNKDFITGQLLNWTLNDTTHRIVIRVGIAYGSDVKKARDIIVNIAQNHPGVLDDPGPVAAFDLFGDSSLNMTLRCFLPNLNDFFSVTHDLHEGIHRELHDAGIEIAFPQRDIHVRSLDPSVRLHESETDRLITDRTNPVSPSHDA